MKALTILSAVLLPAVVVAGVMGMNFKLGFFDNADNFWLVIRPCSGPRRSSSVSRGSGTGSEMAILATVFGLVGRFTGKLLTMSLGWASLLLFGRVPKDKEIFLAAITFGSVLWVVLLVGVLLPDAGVFLLSFAPIPDWVDEFWIRIAMLAAAAIIPPVLSAATLKLLAAKDRPKGSGR